MPTPSADPKTAIYQPGPAVPLGPWRAERSWIARAACARPGVDPDLFTSDEDDHAAVAAAKAICRSGCPVFLDCRIYAEETNPWGVYAGETYAERTRKLHRRRSEGAA